MFDSGLTQDTFSGKLLMMPESFADDCVLLDMDKLMFVARSSYDRCHKYAFLHLNGWLVLRYANANVFSKLDEQECRTLYLNTMRKPYTGELRSLYSALQKVCDQIPKLQWSTLQLNSGVRNYQFNSAQRHAQAAQARPAPAPVMPVPAPVRPASAPAAQGAGTPTTGARPKAGSTTGRVWEICDAALAAAGTIQDWKAFKKSVLLLGVNEGINESTCSVQFGKWRLNLGI